jgi:ornithine cyclodeaminase/alanine dehydrogenase-like protein (mu-crystallin family)
LALKDHYSAIAQMAQLGARYVIIGMEGEPFMDEHFYDPKGGGYPIIEAANDRGMYVVVFTNMSMLTPEILEDLSGKDVSLIGKLNSLNQETNRQLIRVHEDWESYRNVQIPRGLKLMLESRMSKSEDEGRTRLGIDIIVTAMNYRDIPAVAEFAVGNRIKPIVDTLIPVGRASCNLTKLQLSTPQNRWLLGRLRKILGEDFVRDEFVEGCAIRDGVAYDSSGDVRVCCTFSSDVGNIREKPIAEMFDELCKKRSSLPEFPRDERVINSCSIAKHVRRMNRACYLIDSKAVEKVISRVGFPRFMDEAISSVENSFAELNRKEIERLPRDGLVFQSGDLIETMLCRRPGSKVCIKTVSFHAQNQDRGFPTVMSRTSLIDEVTGIPEVIAESSLLTAIRTGVSCAIAAKHLAPPDVRRVVLIGTGTIAQLTLYALARVFPDIEEVSIWDTDRFAMDVFKDRMAELLSIPILVKEPAVSCQNADLICTSTYGTEIVLKDSWVKEGALINAIGSDTPGKQEIDPELLSRAFIVTDYRDQAVYSGELNVPIGKGRISSRAIAAELHEFVAGQKSCDRDAGRITVFDCTGDPVEDMAILELLLEHGLKSGILKPFDFSFGPEHAKDPLEFVRIEGVRPAPNDQTQERTDEEESIEKTVWEF